MTTEMKIETGPDPAAVLSANKFRDRLGGMLVGAFVASLFVLVFKAIPEGNKELIIYMLGQLSGFAAMVVGFHYTMNAINAQASGNTGKLADAFKAAAEAGTGAGEDGTGKDAAASGAGEAAAAAEAEAERLRQEAAEHRG